VTGEPSKPGNPESPESQFDSLAANGFEFLLRAAQLLPTDPKLSLVCFAIGLELVFKARLLLEHWSLILAKPEMADRAKFIDGDFQSVSIDQAISRLENIGNQYFDPDQKKALTSLRKHRNQVVHFFHKAYTPSGDVSEREAVLMEQFRSWFFLRTFTLAFWDEQFEEHRSIAAHIDTEFKKHRPYLQVRFEAVTSPLDQLTKGGARVDNCPSCGYRAMPVREDGKYREGTCLVCELWNRWLEFDCPHCGDKTSFEDITDATCSECEERIQLPDLVGKGGPFQIGEGTTEGYAYCMTCEYSEAKTIVDHGAYLCLACISTQSRIGQCGYCGEDIAPAEPETALFGCLFCEGSWGKVKDE
jgi:hypothetical protein